MVGEWGLGGVKDMRIGSRYEKTLSSGERKRTAIGVELITDPPILILDEPTSGLDSWTAAQIIKLLHRLARRGQTVIATIHQPSSRSFYFFDRLLLIADGQTVYQGPASDAREYFASINHTFPKFVNPADYLIKLL